MTQPARAHEPEPSWHGYDPTEFDEARYDDPFPDLARMRREWPVNETPAGLWRLFRYADCVRVLRELPCGVRRSDGSSTGTAMGGSDDGGQFMLQQDPPKHTRLRKLVSKAFTPRAVEGWRPRVRAIVAELLEPALDAGRFDLVAGLAYPVPSILICEMLGVPSSDRERFTDWTALTTHLLRGVFLTGSERTQAEQAAGSLATYFQELIAERRGHLADDLLSVLIRAEEEGDRLTPDELLVQSMGLLVAGFETTVGLIGLGAKNLIDHPAELAKLRARPELAPSAIEECLRFESPVGMTTRVLHADAVFDGRTIPKDTTVWLSIWSSNRDPAKFREPDRFDVERRENEHLGFGGGTHLCLGAHLARMEAQEALGALAARTKELGRERARVPWGPSLFRVPAKLEVELKAR